jgi:serine/threonine protein kinase
MFREDTFLEKPSNLSVEDASTEEDFYDLLDELGEELGRRWDLDLTPRIKSGEITFTEACERLREAVNGRKKAVDGMRANLKEHYSEAVTEHIRQCVEKILRSRRMDNFLGNGASAEVYAIDNTDNADGTRFCCKFIVNQQRYSEGNTVYQEGDFLQQLSGFSIQEVRSPEFVKCFSGGDLVAIVMERLEAVDLQRVIEGLDNFPEKFDIGDYFRRLRVYISELHAKGIFHQDLYTRNLMVDRETGMPRVIDFGKAHYHSFSDGADDLRKKDLAQIEHSYSKVKEFLLVNER